MRRGGEGRTRHAAAVASTEHGTGKLYREMHVTRVQPAPTRADPREGGRPPAGGLYLWRNRGPEAATLPRTGQARRSRDGARGAEGGWGGSVRGLSVATESHKLVPPSEQQSPGRGEAVRPSFQSERCPRRGGSRRRHGARPPACPTAGARAHLVHNTGTGSVHVQPQTPTASARATVSAAGATPSPRALPGPPAAGAFVCRFLEPEGHERHGYGVTARGPALTLGHGSQTTLVPLAGDTHAAVSAFSNVHPAWSLSVCMYVSPAWET